jgi:hypothetical protein
MNTFSLSLGSFVQRGEIVDGRLNLLGVYPSLIADGPFPATAQHLDFAGSIEVPRHLAGTPLRIGLRIVDEDDNLIFKTVNTVPFPIPTPTVEVGNIECPFFFHLDAVTFKRACVHQVWLIVNDEDVDRPVRLPIGHRI